MPGTYTVKLTANGTSVTRPLTLGMDPRVKTPLLALQRQFSLSKQLSDAIDDVSRRDMTPEVRAPILAALQRVYTDLQDADVAPTARGGQGRFRSPGGRPARDRPTAVEASGRACN